MRGRSDERSGFPMPDKATISSNAVCWFAASKYAADNPLLATRENFPVLGFPEMCPRLKIWVSVHARNAIVVSARRPKPLVGAVLFSRVVSNRCSPRLLTSPDATSDSNLYDFSGLAEYRWSGIPASRRHFRDTTLPRVNPARRWSEDLSLHG